MFADLSIIYDGAKLIMQGIGEIVAAVFYIYAFIEASEKWKIILGISVLCTLISPRILSFIPYIYLFSFLGRMLIGMICFMWLKARGKIQVR